MTSLFPATILACAAAGVCFSCDGQAAGRIDNPIPFFQPTLQLRQDRNPKSSAVAPAQPVAGKLTESSSVPPGSPLVISVSRAELRGSYIRPDEFYLVRTEPQFDRAIDRFVDDVYRPEVFHVGKVPMTFSVWTAIKRKNPLCLLLNPIVFQASW